MRRFNNLYPRVWAFENILEAARNAQKGKRFTSGCRSFNLNLEKNLHSLRDALRENTYQPGAYRRFPIFEPKERMISAAPYPDRVVHHALVKIIEPLFDRSMITDTYANRMGKGTLAAVERFTEFSRRAAYVLKMDIVKYFPNIDHEILLGFLERKIKDRDVLRLIRLILSSGCEDGDGQPAYFPGDDLFSPLNRKKGLPIGNLTSQLFANVYLNGLDHYIKETLRCPFYIRYMDDMVVFAGDKGKLHDVKDAVLDVLESLRLRVHESQAQIWPVAKGTDWLGYRVYPLYRRLRKSNIRRFRHRMEGFAKLYRKGTIGLCDVTPTVMSWIAYAANGDSYRLRERLFEGFVFQRDGA